MRGAPTARIFNVTDLEKDISDVLKYAPPAVRNVGLPDRVEYSDGKISKLSAEGITREFEAAAKEFEAMGKDYSAQIEDVSAMTAEVRATCSALKAKIAGPTVTA